MQRLNSLGITANGADKIPSVIDEKQCYDESSVMTRAKSSTVEQHDQSLAKKLNELLSATTKDHVNKMVSAAKMKCVQQEKDHHYMMQAETCASLCTLNAEKRQMTIQMEVEKVKKNKVSLSHLNKFLTYTLFYFTFTLNKYLTYTPPFYFNNILTLFYLE
jgi:hypothetical protein